MATQAQYEFFKFLFEREDKRYANLLDRGKTFLSLTTLYAGFVAVTVDKPHNNTILSWVLFSLSVGALLGSFLSSILALGIYKYEIVNEPERIIKCFGDTTPTDEDFFDDRIVDFAVACTRNHRQNDKRARLLLWASVSMLIGLFFHASYFLTIGLSFADIFAMVRVG